MEMAKSGTVVTGMSDDIIELTGELGDELYPQFTKEKSILYLAFSDGTLLKVSYSQVWVFSVLVK